MNKVLVTTASFGRQLRSTWVDQISERYDITFNRVDGENTHVRELALHPRLRAKMPKMLAWEDHPNYDYYVWIDASFSLTDERSIERMVDYCVDTDACFFPHPHGRTSVQQELDFIMGRLDVGDQYLLNRCGGEPMVEQVAEYKKDKTWADDFLIAAGTFVYSTRLVNNTEYNVMKEWFHHNCIWSVQDQLSLPYLLHKFNPNFKFFEGNVYDNKYRK